MSHYLKGNIWKLFIADVTQRAYYFPILAIYFLTLPDANAQQIGLWAGIGYLAEFLFEIPSGYISDRIGHKKMLVMAKIFMVIGVLCFIQGSSLIFFILGAIFTSLSFASRSGTKTAFLHETLVSLKREKSFVRISTKIAAYTALASSFLIILIPFAAKISIRTPLFITLVLDLIGLVAVLFLVNPTAVEKSTSSKSVFRLLKELRGSGFYPVVIFTSVITGFGIARLNYVFPYVETLGFPVAWFGIILGFRLLAQFFVANNIGRFEHKINVKRVLLFDLFLFSLVFILIAALDNFYLIVLTLIVLGGYEVGRKAFVEGYLVKNYIQDKRYMATVLSIKGQTTMAVNTLTVFGVGYIMNSSYKAGFYTMGGILFLILLVVFMFIKNRKNN